MLNGIILNMDKMNIYRGLKYAYGFFSTNVKKNIVLENGRKKKQPSKLEQKSDVEATERERHRQGTWLNERRIDMYGVRRRRECKPYENCGKCSDSMYTEIAL